MDELQKILSDPSAMEKISAMARQLMGSQTPEPPPEGGLPGELGQLVRGLGAGKGAHPLALALGPYLGEERRRRLERALSSARAASLSGALFGRGGHGL